MQYMYMCRGRVYIKYTELHCGLGQQSIINVTGCKSKAERWNVGGYEEGKNNTWKGRKREKEGKVNQEEREYLFDD